MLKVFVKRRGDPDRIGQFARAVVAGWAERHLAIVGVWRIGKSRLIEHDFESRAPLPVAVLQGAAASTTIQAFLLAMVRESVNALARACGQQELPRSAGHVEIADRAGSFDARLAPEVGRALALTRARRVDGSEALATVLAFPEEAGMAADSPCL